MRRGESTHGSQYTGGNRDIDAYMYVHIVWLSPQRVLGNISTPIAMNIPST